jgi:glycosyltransferase involved in cell wall biosynthesis
MRIGLIARADSTGLGIQSKEFFNHIPCKALVIDFQDMIPHPGPHHDILKPDLSAFPDQQVFRFIPPHNLSGRIPPHVIDEFLEDLDLVFAMETPYDYNIFEICKARGIKTILQPNYEFLDYPSRLPVPDLFAIPSFWYYDHCPVPKTYLPVPVNTKKFASVPKKFPNTFVHIAGRAAANDRNGTMTFLSSLMDVKSNINVIIRSQIPLRYGYGLTGNINLVIDSSNKADYAENYSGGVLVMPRKYGGLCLPINEALAAWMPVIATNVSPNNEWLPAEWLVDAQLKGQFKSKRTFDFYEANPKALANKIDEFCNPEFYDNALIQTKQLRHRLSWDVFTERYLNVFNDLIEQ